MTEIELNEMIEKYLSNKLGSEEEKKFIELINKNPNIKKEVEEQRILRKAVELNKIEELREELRKESLKDSFSNVNINLFKFSYSKAAIIFVAILLIPVLYLFLNRQDNNYQILFDQYFQISSLEAKSRGLPFERDVNLQKAIDNYKKGLFTEAIPIFKDHVQKNDNDDEIKLYLGIAMLGNKNIEDAKEMFVELEKLNDDNYSIYANWYLALIDIYEGKIDLAKSRLQLVIEQNVFNVKKSEKLLNELNKN